MIWNRMKFELKRNVDGSVYLIRLSKIPFKILFWGFTEVRRMMQFNVSNMRYLSRESLGAWSLAELPLLLNPVQEKGILALFPDGCEEGVARFLSLAQGPVEREARRAISGADTARITDPNMPILIRSREKYDFYLQETPQIIQTALKKYFASTHTMKNTPYEVKLLLFFSIIHQTYCSLIFRIFRQNWRKWSISIIRTRKDYFLR